MIIDTHELKNWIARRDMDFDFDLVSMSLLDAMEKCDREDEQTVRAIEAMATDMISYKQKNGIKTVIPDV